MSEIEMLEAPADSAGFVLWRASNAWQRAVRVVLEPMGVTHAQYVVLATLHWLGPGSGVKQHEVAKLAGMDPMTTSQVARSLEGRHLVRREHHPDDGRAYGLVLTSKGRKLVARAMPAVESAEAAFFSGAGRQQRTVVSALQALAGRG